MIVCIFFSRFFFESERGIFPQTEFVFDLELPIDFKPKNNDGEVDEFVLEKASDVSRKYELLIFLVKLNFILKRWNNR